VRHRLVAVVSSHNETVPHGRLVARRHNSAGLSVLLKAIEWSASVMHSIECSASSKLYYAIILNFKNVDCDLQALPYVALLIAMLFFVYAVIGMQVAYILL